MNVSDKYVHFKGGKYIFKCIAVPLIETHILEMAPETSVHFAKHEGELKEVRLYDVMGITVVDWHEPLVIYQSTEDFYRLNYWARPVDDFFGYKEVNGSLVKRFTKVYEF